LNAFWTTQIGRWILPFQERCGRLLQSWPDDLDDPRVA
jgi:hypothetical protein